MTIDILQVTRQDFRELSKKNGPDSNQDGELSLIEIDSYSRKHPEFVEKMQKMLAANGLEKQYAAQIAIQYNDKYRIAYIEGLDFVDGSEVTFSHEHKDNPAPVLLETDENGSCYVTSFGAFTWQEDFVAPAPVNYQLMGKIERGTRFRFEADNCVKSVIIPDSAQSVFFYRYGYPSPCRTYLRNTASGQLEKFEGLTDEKRNEICKQLGVELTPDGQGNFFLRSKGVDIAAVIRSDDFDKLLPSQFKTLVSDAMSKAYSPDIKKEVKKEFVNLDFEFTTGNPEEVTIKYQGRVLGQTAAQTAETFAHQELRQVTFDALAKTYSITQDAEARINSADDSLYRLNKTTWDLVVASKEGANSRLWPGDGCSQGFQLDLKISLPSIADKRKPTEVKFELIDLGTNENKVRYFDVTTGAWSK